jgi:hypothetical protein
MVSAKHSNTGKARMQCSKWGLGGIVDGGVKGAKGMSDLRPREGRGSYNEQYEHDGRG